MALFISNPFRPRPGAPAQPVAVDALGQPALIVDGDGRVRAANLAADRLSRALLRRPYAALVSRLARAALEGAGHREWIALPQDMGEGILDLTVVPLAGGQALVVAQRGRRDRDWALARAERRARLSAGILGAIRGEADPDRMLVQALDAVSGVFVAHRCALYRMAAGAPVVAAAAGAGGPAAGPLVAACLRRAGAVTLDTGDGHALAIATRCHGGANGALGLWRDADNGPWTEEERALAAEAAGHFGIALALATSPGDTVVREPDRRAVG